MVKVTLDLIQQLRERTGMGLMDCRKALEAVDGDMDKAVEMLRKKGADVAAKRASNLTAEGKFTRISMPEHALAYSLKSIVKRIL